MLPLHPHAPPEFCHCIKEEGIVVWRGNKLIVKEFCFVGHYISQGSPYCIPILYMYSEIMHLMASLLWSLNSC